MHAVWCTTSRPTCLCKRHIGGKQLKAEHTDYLQEFFRVYASEQANPSVLSLSDVEDFYRVTYVTGGAFILHLPSYDLAFKRTGKLYVPIVGKFWLLTRWYMPR